MSQFLAFSRQMPLLYFVLISNTAAIAWNFAGSAPDLLAIHIPAALIGLCTIRLLVWQFSRTRTITADYAIRRLKVSNFLAVGLAAAVTAWGLALLQHGGPYMQAHIAFFMGITVVGCAFCLMHLRSAALLVTVIVNVPVVTYFFIAGPSTFIAIGINLLLVSLAMMVVVCTHYRTFAHLIESRKELIVRQEETRKLFDENLRLANLDSLTLLPNRRSFFARLGTDFASAHAASSRLAVGIVDLDGFKPVNDIHGHTAGDEVLGEVGRRIREIAAGDIFIARLGGDEFGLIVTNSPPDDDLVALGERICAALAAPYALANATAQLSGSIGFATFPETRGSPSLLFERADYALYHAKRSRRGAPVVFSTQHEAEIRRSGVVERALLSGDLENELTLSFQPIMDLHESRIVTFEALARWHSPQIGTVPPGRFIPIAEKSGKVHVLTRILLRKALEAVARLPEPYRVAFNLSAQDIASADGVLRLMSVIGESGVDPRRLDLEITETAIMHDIEQAGTAIRMLKSLGVGISLDDFGTGFSSLSQVHRLPLDRLKIDRSFIADIETNRTSYNIVKSLIALCRDMELNCVAEGVETQAQMRVLESLGCRKIQGFIFGRPMPFEEIEPYLARFARRRTA